MSTAMRNVMMLPCLILTTAYCDPQDGDVDATPGTEDSPRQAAERALFDDPHFAVDATTWASVEQLTGFRVAHGVGLTADAEREGWELRYRLARAVQRAPRRGGEEDRILVEYLGHGDAHELVVDTAVPLGDDSVAVPRDLQDGALWLDGFSSDTRNEFRVRIPGHLSRAVGEWGFLVGLHLGAGDPGSVPTRGWSDGEDSRVMIGQVDVAQTDGPHRRLVQINAGCSGTLVGPKHTLTAAHCVWDWTGPNTGSWGTGTLRAGRNGAAWLADASISSQRWYWVPSQYRAAATNPGHSEWDIGMYVTHGSRMGEDPDVGGWLGWWWFTSTKGFESNDKYNRGYPACGNELSPESCVSNHLYGDTQTCDVGDYGGGQDSASIPRKVKHSCDTSGGMSGSSLYEYNDDTEAWVVTAVHTGRDGNEGPRTNYATRITRDYSDALVMLRETFP